MELKITLFATSARDHENLTAPLPSLNLLSEIYRTQLHSAQLRRGNGGTQSPDTARNLQGHRIFCNEKVEFRPAAHAVLEAGDSEYLGVVSPLPVQASNKPVGFTEDGTIS
jgi:hypothetical protein